MLDFHIDYSQMLSNRPTVLQQDFVYYKFNLKDIFQTSC